MDKTTDKYVMSTRGTSDKDLNIGDVVYAKKNKKTNKVSFYEKNARPDDDILGTYITTVRGTKEFVDKFDMPLKKRKAYMVCDIDGFNYTLDYLYQEDDIIETEEKGIYRNLIYKMENNRIVICGIVGEQEQVVIPRFIDDKEIYAIGNMDNNGIYYPLEMNSSMFYKIILPDTIKEIYPFAFMNKTVDIQFPNSLYYIGEKAFYGARIFDVDLSITKLDIIERECFAFSKVESVSLPPELIRIRQQAFKYSSVKEVEFNSNVEVIEKEAFYDCVIDTNRTIVDFIEKNAFTCETPAIFKKCESISYDDIQYQIIGHVKYDDYGKDKVLEDFYIDENCQCLKQVFFAKNGNTKYEILVEYDEEYGNEDLFLEYIKYVNSVRISLYRVNEFELTRFFETYIPDYEDVRISGRIEDGQISAKYDDETGKIIGLKLSERYRYNYDDWVYNEFNSGEFSERNKFLALVYVFGKNEESLEMSAEEMEEYNEVKERYMQFLTPKKVLADQVS